MVLFTGLTKGLLAPRLPRYFREAVLERSHVGLKFGRHLLETVDGQMISGAEIVLVVVLVNGAIGRPAP